MNAPLALKSTKQVGGDNLLRMRRMFNLTFMDACLPKFLPAHVVLSLNNLMCKLS